MNNLAFIIIILLVLVLLLTIFKCQQKNPKLESFETTSWGYQPEGYAPVDQYTQNNLTVGPSSSCNDITGWQYNPQNTQVDYHFYNKNNDLDYFGNQKNEMNIPINTLRNTNRIAPITRGEVGILTNPTYQTVNEPNPQLSTRVPNDYSTENLNIIPNPTTNPALLGSCVNYEWDTPDMLS